MSQPLSSLTGKEVHVRLASNELLEADKRSVTAIGLTGTRFETKGYADYRPKPLLAKLLGGLAGRSVKKSDDPRCVVLVEERKGSLNPDDARYIEWLADQTGERPAVLLVPEKETEARLDPSPAARRHEPGPDGGAFWSVQWRRFCALPAPITKDAALAAIPRTAIPIGFSIFLALLKRDEVPLERAALYVGLAFAFAVGFALCNQTVLNWFTFWSQFTREGLEPMVHRLERAAAGSKAGRGLVALLSFVSARGDVLIAAPLLGVSTSYLARLVLGPVGETVSVLTLKGFWLVFLNVLIGSIAGGPYPQVIAHLRAVGRVTERTSIYLGILDTVKMELGRIADFGFQTLYNSIQVVLAVVFWVMLLVADRCYPKPEVTRLAGEDLAAARALFAELRGRRGAGEPSMAA